MNRKPQANFSGENNQSIAIKQTLLAQRLTVTALAKRLRKSRKATSVAINHPKRYPKLRARIEEVLGGR